MNTGPDPSGPFGRRPRPQFYRWMYNIEVVQIKCEMLVDNGSIQFEFKDSHQLI